MMGDFVSVGWERSGDHKRNSDPGTALSSCPDAGRNLDLEIRKVKSGEGQTPGQKEE